MSEIDSTAEKSSFEIPEPKIVPVLESPGVTTLSANEAIGFSGDKESEMRRVHWDWRLRYCFKILLFVFVLALNIIWTYLIASFITRSGTDGSKFHLSDSVLIALASTSIANFLGLVVIVARHLFPSNSPK
jgi:hypothetical protein